MNFKQFYLGCLSHASYYVGSDGEAAIIDPQRDVQQYMDEAVANGEQIKYVIETHSHADFVSGHVELAAQTGAEIIYGQRAETQFSTHKVKDGDELQVGAITLRFLETPGHTPEGITIVAEERSGDTLVPIAGSSGEPLFQHRGGVGGDRSVPAPLKIFTGDTLFIGDVGRPDLIGSEGFSAEQMAAMLYDSVHNKILTMPDETEIYPAHGAGSMCGKNLSSETWSTLGEQRRVNYALQPMSKKEFVTIVTADQTEVPMYFPRSAAKNLAGPGSLADLPRPEHLTSDKISRFSGVIIDVRSAAEYGRGHVPGSINIGLAGQFASWAGSLTEIGTPLALVADSIFQVDEAVMRLARVGHETVTGFILFDEYTGDESSTKQVTVSEARDYVESGRKAQFIDVRRAREYAAGHAVAAQNVPLATLGSNLDGLDPAAPTYVICEGGYRSSIGTSILEKAGYSELYNVTDGTSAWIAAELPTETTNERAAVS